MAAWALAGTANAQIVPTPRATALPPGVASRPFLAARQTLQPVELAARGYVEEEFLLSGQANVYEWTAPGAAEGAVRVLAANVSYTTRFLLRRPADAKKSSGRVIVELLDPGTGYDVAPLWGLAYEQFLRSGDIYIGVTVHPAALQALKQFDAQRYAKLSFALPQAADCASGDSTGSESGLAWDAIAQLGALLRSSSRDNPLGRYPVRSLLAGGYAQSGGYLITYLNAQHARLRLGDDSPIYDGYLQVAGSTLSAPLSQCGAPLPVDDPRRRLGAHDVPVIFVNTQSDYRLATALRLVDSEAANARFRQYELPGVGQQGPWPAGRPNTADLKQLGLQRFDPGEQCDAPATDLAANASYHVIWSWLQHWAERREDPAAAAPASRLLNLDANGGLARDGQGNATGGLRLPFLDVPVASYAGDSPTASADVDVQKQCRLSGSMRRFDAAALKLLYPSKGVYLRQFNAATERLVGERAIQPADAPMLKALAAGLSFPP